MNLTLRRRLGWAVAAALAFAGSVRAQIPPLKAEYVASLPLGGGTIDYNTSLYPSALSRSRTTAQAVVECRIAESRLVQCKTLDATPAGMGIESMAVVWAEALQVRSSGADAASSLGKYIVLPVKFAPRDILAPMTKAMVGGEAFLITPDHGPILFRGQAPCPTAQNPQRRCYLYDVAWATRPDFGAAAATVLQIGKTTGTSGVDCALTATGQLSGCAMTPDLNPGQRALLLTLLADFTTAKIADQHQAASSRVEILFDWAALNAAIDASALKTPR